MNYGFSSSGLSSCPPAGGVSLNTNTLRSKGIAIVNFNNNEIAQQNNAQSRGIVS